MSQTPVCRCCLSEACFKDISHEYFYGGRKEVYADMIFDTFNLTLSYQGDTKRLICEECIVKLRDAAEFRKQVVLAEAAINRVSLEVQPKAEKIDTESDDFLDHVTGSLTHEDGDMCAWGSDDIADGENTIVKLEPGLPEYEKYGGKKSKSKKSEKKKSLRKIITRIEKSSKRHRTVGNTTQRKDAKRNKENSPATRKTSEQLKIKVDPSQSQINLKHNSLQLILNSNLCIFESLKTKFRCFFCKSVYLNMADLKAHAIGSHTKVDYITTCINRLKISCKNVEITDLKCNICDELVKDLTTLQMHLTESHKIKFLGSENVLVPYKILNGFQCIVCDEKFHTYYKLSVHMNSHYTNHVCDTCGLSYINRIGLRIHIHSMHREKKCTKCPATFINNYSRVKHMRKVHNSSESKRYCLLCDKTFRYTYNLIEHRIEEHGAKRQTVNCSQCGKTCKSEANLRVHVRSFPLCHKVHIRERNYPCQYCGMSFFTSCDQRRHERTHQDIQLFSCSFCEGRFKSKDSLRRHLRRQHGHLFNPAASAEQ